MAEKFVVRPKWGDKKDDRFVTMTIRIERRIQDRYGELAEKSGRSRNELMGMALQYALDNLEFIPAEEEK